MNPWRPSLWFRRLPLLLLTERLNESDFSWSLL